MKIDNKNEYMTTITKKFRIKKTTIDGVKKEYKMYVYSSNKRNAEIGTFKKRKNILKLKEDTIDNESIIKMETKLSKYNSKSVSVKEFDNYAKEKINFVDKLIKQMSYREYLNKSKFNMYSNKRRHEDNFLNELEEVYGKGTIIILGVWSQKNCGNKLKGSISTLTKRLLKLLRKRFTVYLIDEFLTSQLNSKTKGSGDKLKNLTIKKTIKENGKNKEILCKMHSVLTFSNELKKSGCINRDFNATLNMLNILETLIKTKIRPIEFTRNNSHIFKKVDNNDSKKSQKIKIRGTPF
jgi:hypothetical protein